MSNVLRADAPVMQWATTPTLPTPGKKCGTQGAK